MINSKQRTAVVCVVLAIVLLFSGVPMDTEASTAGAWVLVKTEYNDSNNAANWSTRQPERLGTEYVYGIFSKGKLEFASVLEPNPATTSDRTVQNMRATYTWDAPPAEIAPNSTVTMKVNREVKSNQQGVYTSGPANTVGHSAVGATLRNANFSAPDGQNYTYNVFGTTSGAGRGAYLSIDSLVSDYTFAFAGPGQVGSQQQIRFVFNAGSFLYYENYIYEWQEGRTAEPTVPSTQPGIQGWVLVKTEYNDSNNAANWLTRQPERLGTKYVYGIFSKGKLEFTSVLEPNPATTSDRTVQNMRATYTWDAPPAVIAPNSTVVMKVNREVKSNQQGVYTSGPANTVGHSAVGATLRNANFRAPDGQNYTYNVFGTTSGAGRGAYLSIDSLVSGYTFTFAGPGQVGSQQQIRFVFNAGSFLYYENYIYEWQEGRTAEPTTPSNESSTPSTQPTVPVLERKSFSDLPTSHWAYDTVIEMVNMGILSGYPDGTFRPNNTISRVEFAKIMVMALDLPTSKPASATFSDVTNAHWAYEAVESAKEYLTGYLNSSTGAYTFEPNSVAVREDVAVAIVKAKNLGSSPVNMTVLNQFSDQNQISQGLRQHVAIAVEKGFMRGTNIGFEPQKALTRAEACALLSQLIDRSQLELEKRAIQR